MKRLTLEPTRKLPIVAIAVGVAVAVLIAGLSLGWTSQVSAADRRADTAEAQLSKARSQVARYRANEQQSIDAQNAANAERESYEDRQDALQKKTADVDALKKQLDEQQQAVVASQLTDGMHVVGTDTQPGVYSITESTNCYYVWKTGTGSDADIVDNNIVSGPATVTLKPGEVFETQGCGSWNKVG